MFELFPPFGYAASMNNCVQVLLWTCFISLGYLGVELLGETSQPFEELPLLHKTKILYAISNV